MTSSKPKKWVPTWVPGVPNVSSKNFFLGHMWYCNFAIWNFHSHPFYWLFRVRLLSLFIGLIYPFIYLFIDSIGNLFKSQASKPHLRFIDHWFEMMTHASIATFVSFQFFYFLYLFSIDDFTQLSYVTAWVYLAKRLSLLPLLLLHHQKSTKFETTNDAVCCRRL